MTGRDRIVMIGLIVVAVLAGGWILVVSPSARRPAALPRRSRPRAAS